MTDEVEPASVEHALEILHRHAGKVDAQKVGHLQCHVPTFLRILDLLNKFKPTIVPALLQLSSQPVQRAHQLFRVSRFCHVQRKHELKTALGNVELRNVEV